MSASFGRNAAAPARSRRSALLVATALAAVVGLAGCAMSPPMPSAGPHPADPGAGAPAARYSSTIAPYVSRRPVEPGPWREQNERVAPERRP